MVISSLDAFKNSLKNKETGIEKEIVEVLQQASDGRNKTWKWYIQMIKILAFTLYFLARLTLTLAFAIQLLLLLVVSFQEGIN